MSDQYPETIHRVEIVKIVILQLDRLGLEFRRFGMFGTLQEAELTSYIKQSEERVWPTFLQIEPLSHQGLSASRKHTELKIEFWLELTYEKEFSSIKVSNSLYNTC